MRAPFNSSAISAHQAIALTANWQLAETPPDSLDTPRSVNNPETRWRDAIVPGTVAQAIHTDINFPGLYDDNDWWYRCSFVRPQISPGEHCRLRCEGLATLADVWLNDQLLFSSADMFVAQTVDITALLRDDNDLYIRFRSATQFLQQRKPRPRWKTALVNHQNLRWLRTTLLGRMPGWSPPIHPVGPWRPINLEIVRSVDVRALNLQTRARGSVGIVNVHVDAKPLAGPIQRARLVVGDYVQELQIDDTTDSQLLSGEFEIPDVPLWWPHTHGEPTLLPCRIELELSAQLLTIACGHVGFKNIQIDRSNNNLQFIVNDVPIFCRGACWTINDFKTLTGSATQLRTALELARDAHLNMLRIGGTMVYESDEFYRLCDELGILVWQDFMFANMDYPVADPEFRNLIETEVSQQLQRLQKHVCLTAYCAGSEIEQQAAMLGLPASEWSNEFFAEQLPQLCQQLHQDIPYFRGSPTEGALPFHVGTGVSHYYGVGAYRRPLSDAKHAGVKFTTETLGFSHVPEARTMELLLDGAIPVPHHPRWKARVPRDNGTGWDFEDIRDFYLRELFQIDPIALRSTDLERYYALSRVVTGEVLLRTYAEWRRRDNPCAGALVWFYKDLWPGAGWGVIDSENTPKAVYWYLQRAWAPQALLLTDEGQDGLSIHILNDRNTPLAARVAVKLYRDCHTTIAAAETLIEIAARSATKLAVDAVIGHFTDAAYCYKFGPPKHDVVAVQLLAPDSEQILSEDYFFPLGHQLAQQRQVVLESNASFDADGNVTLTLKSDTFLQSVALTATHFLPTTNYFHLAPNIEYTIKFRAQTAGVDKFKVAIDTLNFREGFVVRASRQTGEL